ncbi:hypothetical protein [Segatella bryantii]|uniref:Apea-like HEPN domain-containing protein n=1 Tax=Segatella bryantii TaxID=77095 RepID=A0ABX4EE51_SEGBR|nr:hypothetical protein [Segatella bryantii]OYP53179.1 hypothetical protein CIK91_13330 [Segatella bryantii]UKK80526.1 hypothetical protein L6474_07635 [Segatella bryantii]
MNRNIKNDLQKKLFSLLSKETGINVNNYPNARICLTREEYNALQHDVLPKATLCLGRNQIASIYKYKGLNYLIVPNVYENVSLTSLSLVDDIKEISFVYIVSNSISPSESATEAELEEHIFIDENVEDIQWEEITPFFPKFSLFQINDSVLDNELPLYLKRMCIAFVCETKEMQQLPYDSDTIAAFVDIANSTDVNIPYDNILRSLLSYHWKFCFIDLYRCQERLLLLAWVEEFKNSMNSGLSLSDLHGKMKDRYKTEHHERENMQSLYNFLPQTILDSLTSADTTIKKANYIYDLRNKIVHYQRTDFEVDSKPDSEWNMIVSFVLKTIPFLYNKFSQHITELPDL